MLAGTVHLTRGDAAAAVSSARAATAVDGLLRVVRQEVTEPPFGELHTVVTQPGVLAGPSALSTDTLHFYAVPPIPRPASPPAAAPPPSAVGPVPASAAPSVDVHAGGAAISPAPALSVLGRLEEGADRTARNPVGAGSSFVLGVGAPKVGKSAVLTLVPAVLQFRLAVAGARPAVFFEHSFSEGLSSPAACMVQLLEDLHEFRIHYRLAAPGSTLADGHAARPFSAFQTLVPSISQQLANIGYGPLIILIDECGALLVNRGQTDEERTLFRQQRTAYLAAIKHVVWACRGAHVVCTGSGMVQFIDAMRSMGSGGFVMFDDAYILRMGDSLPPQLALQVAEDLATRAGIVIADAAAPDTVPKRVLAALAHPMLSVRTALIADILRRYRHQGEADLSVRECAMLTVLKMAQDMRNDTLPSLDGVDPLGLDTLRNLASDVDWMSGSPAPPSISGVAAPGGRAFSLSLQRFVSCITDRGLPGGRRELQRPYGHYVTMATGLGV